MKKKIYVRYWVNKSYIKGFGGRSAFISVLYLFYLAYYSIVGERERENAELETRSRERVQHSRETRGTSIINT